MSRAAFGASRLCWLAGLLACAALTACKPKEIPVACTPLPIVDGYETAMTEGGKMRLRLPKHASRLTDDCKQIKWAVLDYYWHDGKLIKRDAENQFDGSIPQSSRQQVVEVHLTSFQFLHEAQHNFQNDTSLFAFKPWRIEGAVRHYKYPLELYPKFYWAGPDQPPINTSSDARWGVVGTKNAITQYPSTTACGIVHSASEPEANIIKGDFPNDYSDAKCRGGISIVKGDKVAFGMIDVWANNAHDIDKIYNAVISKIQTYIQE